jgi:hypothetical protein
MGADKKERFYDDLEKLNLYTNKSKEEISQIYKSIEKNEHKDIEILYEFANKLNIKELDKSLSMALSTRLVDLKENLLISYCKNKKHSKDETTTILANAYLFVKDYWHKVHKQRISYIQEHQLFNQFYIEIFKGIYDVGVEFTNLEIVWHKHIEEINRHLYDKFDGDRKKIITFLKENNLLDVDKNQKISDRCYSMLRYENNNYKLLAFYDIFRNETSKILNKLEEFTDRLIELEDDIFGAKWDYILYFQTITRAIAQRDVNKLIESYKDIDIAWMKIKTPIQIGHMFEYYDDHYRKSVSIEWDIRISNVDSRDNKVADNISSMYKNIFLDIQNKNIANNEKYQKIYDNSLSSLNRIDLHIGRPILFFASAFNGMFSAQVVPNDQDVSTKYGKKIFAFNDDVLQTQQAKPFLKLHKNIFGKEFISKYRAILFGDKEVWNKIYSISTIGHEYGHILWIDDNSEKEMNSSGNYKNIEEFKATSGGLVSYFMNSDTLLQESIIIDTIHRAITLISWMKIEDVEPYYCEGLIHLKLLFASDILKYNNNKLEININDNNTKSLIQLYKKTYIVLAMFYLEKRDAKLFLDEFMDKKDDYFLPIDHNIRQFVTYYHEEYEKIGTHIDTNDQKSNYQLK